MSDVLQNKNQYHKYRYSISQLIELAATAYLSFDLSKFSYEAARAGVIPSLGDCAMSSRKSSASCARSNIETASSTDLLVFQGNRVLRPDRQPNLPPPVERQKDEGFAKFLKQHSSPTHNRVTAAGRIVPMEPRSPPAFSLPGSAASHPHGMLVDQHTQNTRPYRDNDWTSAGRDHQQPNDRSFHPASLNQVHFDAGLQRTNGFGGSPAQAPHHDTIQNYEPHMTASSMPGATSVSSPTRADFTSQWIGGPVMAQSLNVPQYSIGPYYNGNMVNLGTGVSLGDQYHQTMAWPTYNQSLHQQYPTQQMMSPQQLLASWEQHYADLDQQLKHIDRHRAMNNLDPTLAEQRRVIVQQRSDAKDVVKHYQAMLGIKRYTDSSQDSYAAGFNIDAPAYVPARELDLYSSLGPKKSIDVPHNVHANEQPQGSTKRHAIPIVAPPEKGGNTRTPVTHQGETTANFATTSVDEWGIQTRAAPLDVQREQSELSEIIEAEQKRRLVRQESVSASRSSSQGACQFAEDTPDTEAHPVAVEESGSVRITRIRPANITAPLDMQEEYVQLIGAVSQPKGTITQVRLLDNRVIDVEGQGLDLALPPLSPTQLGRNQWSGQSSVEIKASSYRSQSGRQSMASTNQRVTMASSAGKENLSVTPRRHTKAATDAFLTQFDAVENNIVLTAKAETQSLRSASNVHADAEEQKYLDYYQQDPFPTTNIHSSRANGEAFPVSVQTPTACAEATTPVFADTWNNKGYSSVSIQNIHAVGSLPNNFDGAVEARLAAAEKSKSPRLLRRGGNKNGAWYGPYCRDIVEKVRMQNEAHRPARTYFN